MNDNKVVVTPSVLLIIIILAIIFFLSGVLLRFLWRPQPTHPNDVVLDTTNNNNNLTALQGQLQQLFHLHDSGVDQSFIDTLPVFPYNSILGLKFKTPFDCAICLSEFEPLNSLRLLPNCSHAFHLHCIDTWLLSHSTCPLCRSSLLHNSNNTLFPRSSIVLVLESGSDSSPEIVPQQEQEESGSASGSTRLDAGEVITVKLGKFRNVDEDGSGSSSSGNTNNKIDARRCFSMGSFAYVMDENSSLRVPIRAQIITNNSIETARRAVSFRFPLQSRNDDGHDHLRGKNEKFETTSTISESEFGYDDENQSLEARAPSFARRTLLWLTGKQNKVVHSSSASSDNV